MSKIKLSKKKKKNNDLHQTIFITSITALQGDLNLCPPLQETCLTPVTLKSIHVASSSPHRTILIGRGPRAPQRLTTRVRTAARGPVRTISTSRPARHEVRAT